MGDRLPDADKYIYLDSDVLMIQHGDWEAEECLGAVSEQRFRIRARHYFSSGEDCDKYLQLLREQGNPERVNTGCVVLPAGIRRQVGERWLYWCKQVEDLCEKPLKMRDQPQFPFVMHEFNIPVLPSRFCAIVKREPITDEHIALHASGHPSGNSLKKYTDIVDRLLGGALNVSNPQDITWQVLTELLMRYAKDSAYPVVGVLGEDANTLDMLQKTFPGLELHYIEDVKDAIYPFDLLYLGKRVEIAVFEDLVKRDSGIGVIAGFGTELLYKSVFRNATLGPKGMWWIV